MMPLKEQDLPTEKAPFNLIIGAGLSKQTAGWLVLLREKTCHFNTQ